MNAYRLKPTAFPWPPVLYSIAFAGAGLLGRVIQLQMPARTFLVLTGLSLLGGAFALALWALKAKFDARALPRPHRSRVLMVTSGPYRLSRNPIYLAYTIGTMAVGLLSGNPWFVLAGPTAAIVTTQIAIRREEMLLLARYGMDYERYCRQVRRWL